METSVATGKGMASPHALSNVEPFSTPAGRYQEEGSGRLIGEITRANIDSILQRAMEQYTSTPHGVISPDDSYEEEVPDASVGVLILLQLVQTGVLPREQIVTDTTEREVEALPLAPPLQDALKDLDASREEAREEEYPEPSDLAIANARRLLLQMYEITPRRFEVYPTPDGEIAIDAPGGYGRSVLLLCDSDGGALCLVNTSGNGDRRARYRTTDTLPDGFVREALEDIREYK